MTRQRMIEIFASELEKCIDDLPLNAAAMIAEFRKGNHGPAFEAAIRSMARVEKECDAER